MQIISNNLVFTLLDPQIITKNLKDDLLSERVIPAVQSYPFISSPLGLILKLNHGFYCIYHLSHPRRSLVNDFTLKKPQICDILLLKK